MSTSPTLLLMLDFAAALSAMALQWLVQSTLVIAVGLAADGLVHRRGPALRSAIYRATLVAIFACPIATWLVSTSGVASAVGWLPSFRPAVMQVAPYSTQLTRHQTDRTGDRHTIGEGLDSSEVAADVRANSLASPDTIDGMPDRARIAAAAVPRSISAGDARNRTVSSDGDPTAATSSRFNRPPPHSRSELS